METTLQSIFNTVYTGLLAQNKKSMDGIFCAYRGKGGTKCAAGLVITDDEYDPKMDDSSLDCSVKGLERAKLLPKRLKPFVNELSSLQNIHDCFEPVLWKERLEHFAAKHELQIPT